MKLVNNTSHNLSRDVVDGNNQMVMMHANIRPNQGVNINLEVLNATYAEQNRREIAAEFEVFVRDVMARAATDGLPVSAIADFAVGEACMPG